MNDLGYQLRSGLNQTRVRRGNVGSVYSVRRGILNQQRQECEDAPDEEAEDEDIDENEDDYSAPHCDSGIFQFKTCFVPNRRGGGEAEVL